MNRSSLSSSSSVADKPIWAPAVVVGIDFGMTCTGVAYSSEDYGWGRPEVIQRWPDLRGALYDKYPSRIAYNNAGSVVDWGICNVAQDIAMRQREFKLHLHPSFRDLEGGLSHEEAVKYYIDYMTVLYKHINKVLAQQIPRWTERNVEYRFSIPTTWKNPILTEKQKSWLAAAGFTNTSTRRVIFSRTEAESAAVYIADQYQEDDVIMIVDAGGATTDLNILKIEEKSDKATQMRALDKAEGVNIGAVMIDVEVRRIVEQKLRSMQVQADIELKWLAESMMERSGFEIFKRTFGSDDGLLDLYMEIPGVPGNHIVLKSSEMRCVFDNLIEGLTKTMKEKILSLSRAMQTQEQLRYIVLSGGLGSSKYVKERLTAEFCNGSLGGVNAMNLQILVAAEPQLAVVKGLVTDRSQTLYSGIPAWIGRCCRVSYGVLCKYPYDRRKHAGEPTVKDPLTGNLWVEDQIDWLIKEGDIVPEDGLKRGYSLRVPPNKRFETFQVHIVMSELPASQLPRSRHRGPVSRVCSVEGTFSPGDFSSPDFKSVKSILHKERNHDIAHFKLKVIVGSADLAFEFTSVDGKRTYSQNSEQVNVVWDDVRPALQQVNNYSRIFPPSLYSR